MIVPANYESMSDEELLAALTTTYGEGAAQYVFDTLRGKLSDEASVD